jgi:hypothetical protein
LFVLVKPVNPLSKVIQGKIFQTSRVANLPDGSTPDLSNPGKYGLPDTTMTVFIEVGRGKMGAWWMQPVEYNVGIAKSINNGTNNDDNASELVYPLSAWNIQ